MLKRAVISFATCALMIAMVAGDSFKVKAGTPPIINATWTGPIQTFRVFDHPFFVSSLGPGPETTQTDEVTITVPDGVLCSGAGNPPTPCAIATQNQIISLPLSSGETLIKGNGDTVTLNITATKQGITGTVSSGDSSTGTIDGFTVAANRFYLLNITVAKDGAPCSPAQFQGTASIVPSAPNLMIFTGSGVDFDCNQQMVTGRFTK